MSAKLSLDARDLARIAVFAALIIVLGTVAVPLPGGVPVTAQTLAVMLAGTVLGARRARLAVLVVLVLAAVGLPVLSGGRGGLGVFVGPTAGYLLGWVFGAWVIGLIAHRQSRRPTWWRVGAGTLIGGIAVIYLFGVPVQSLVTGVDPLATLVSTAAFLPGDLLKVVLATALTLALHRAYPRAFGQRSSSSVDKRTPSDAFA